MDSQSATPAADAAGTVIDIITARLEQGAPDRQLPGLAEFLAGVPNRRRPGKVGIGW